MMQLHCLHCGPRPESEFTCGGTTAIARPALNCSDEAWGQYLFFRSNPRGDHAERWRHTHGCGVWFNALRCTTTHQVKAVYAVTAPCPVPLSTAGSAGPSP
jgi:sarcosine oxidase, subunit delta